MACAQRSLARIGPGEGGSARQTVRRAQQVGGNLADKSHWGAGAVPRSIPAQTALVGLLTSEPHAAGLLAAPLDSSSERGNGK